MQLKNHTFSISLFRYSMLVAMLWVSLVSYAAHDEWRERHCIVAAVNHSPNYIDSLAHLSDSIYAPTTHVPSSIDAQDMAPLFLPLTFYKSIIHRAFAMNSELSSLDRHLLQVYLERPDMVRVTQSMLEKKGPALAPATIAQKPSVIVEKTSPTEPQEQLVDVVVLKPNFWKFSGDYYLQFLQNYISANWYKGGESNYSMVGALNLEAHYDNKSKLKWDNKLELKLGFQTSKSDSLHKLRSQSDLIRFTSKLGLQATKKWYYTFQLIANTQFMRNWKTNKNEVQSDFASPLNINASLGMDYNVDWLNHRLTGTFHLAPLAYNFKYVGRLELAPRNGIEKGKHSLHDFGSQFVADLKWKMSDNIMWQSRLYGYTTYKRSEMEWENTFTFQFNKYISSKFFIYPRFDDGARRDEDHGYWMFKEYFALGFSYNF